jgi:hypothetical protein
VPLPYCHARASASRSRAVLLSVGRTEDIRLLTLSLAAGALVPRCDVEPVDQMLTGGMKILLKLSYAVAGIATEQPAAGSLAFLATSVRAQ